MTNSEALTTIRKRLGLTKKEASEKLGCTPKTYAKYEKDGIDNVKLIAAIIDFGLDLESTKTLTVYFNDSEPLVLMTKATS